MEEEEGCKTQHKGKWDQGDLYPSMRTPLPCVSHIKPAKLLSWLTFVAGHWVNRWRSEVHWKWAPSWPGEGKVTQSWDCSISQHITDHKRDLKETWSWAHTWHRGPGSANSHGPPCPSMKLKHFKGSSNDPGVGPGYPRSDDQLWMNLWVLPWKWGCVAFLPSIPWTPQN